MNRTNLAFSAVALLALAGVCSAQPPGITPEMINTTLPLEGAPLAVKGDYDVKTEPAFGNPGLVVVYPTDLGRFPRRDTLPVVVWGNGGCAINSTRYNGFFSTIASHGFLVIGTAAVEGAQRRQANADDLRGAIDWAEKENARGGSPLQGKIDTGHVAVMGQSCGGFLSVALGADPRVDTIGVFNSGVQPRNPNAPAGPFPTMDSLKDLHGPVLLINGAERDFMTAQSKATYDAIQNLPAFYGARAGAGHTATVDHPGGGEYANVATNWVLWQFKGDKKASKMFVGEDCDLCKLPTWETASKGLTDRASNRAAIESSPRGVSRGDANRG